MVEGPRCMRGLVCLLVRVEPGAVEVIVTACQVRVVLAGRGICLWGASWIVPCAALEGEGEGLAGLCMFLVSVV